MVVSLQKKYLTGFTLAETLITLMVIGILAVITIPGLIQSWEKQAQVNQLKKTYSLLTQIFKLIAAEESGITVFTPTELRDKIAKYTKVQSKCTNCMPNINGLKTDGPKESARETSATTPGVILIDGSIITVLVANYSYFSGGDPRGGASIIIADTNGNKAPNQWGRDIFTFWLFKNGDISPAYNYAVLSVIKNDTSTSAWCFCNEKYAGTAWGCAARIFKENWQMTY